MGREKLQWLWILNSELKRKIGDLFKQIYMTEDRFLKVYLRGCFTDSYAALSSWKLCFVTSMLLKKFSSRHDKLLPYIQFRVVRMQVIKNGF